MRVSVITVCFFAVVIGITCFILFLPKKTTETGQGLALQMAEEIRIAPEGGWLGILTEPRIFSSEELDILIASAPHHPQTRTNFIHPDGAMSRWERDYWIEDYNARGGINAQEFELYKIVNEIREEHGLPPFILCPRLSMAARLFSFLQVKFNSSGHEDPYYGDLVARMNFFGIYGTVYMENANSEQWYEYPDGSREYIFLSPQELVDGWMSSPPHRAHILTTETTHVGFGVDSGNNRVVPTMKSILPR